MAFRKFEELPVWRASADLAVRVLDWVDRGMFSGHPGLRDQIERAAISVSNNIAEGYERGTYEESLTFLYYARGSAGEVRSMLNVMGRAETCSGRREEIESARANCLEVSRQLGAWIESVKNSDYGGTRQQTDAARDARQAALRRAEFMDNLRRIAEAAANRPWTSAAAGPRPGVLSRSLSSALCFSSFPSRPRPRECSPESPTRSTG